MFWKEIRAFVMKTEEAITRVWAAKKQNKKDARLSQAKDGRKEPSPPLLQGTSPGEAHWEGNKSPGLGPRGPGFQLGMATLLMRSRGQIIVPP